MKHKFYTSVDLSKTYLVHKDYRELKGSLWLASTYAYTADKAYVDICGKKIHAQLVTI